MAGFWSKKEKAMEPNLLLSIDIRQEVGKGQARQTYGGRSGASCAAGASIWHMSVVTLPWAAARRSLRLCIDTPGREPPLHVCPFQVVYVFIWARCICRAFMSAPFKCVGHATLYLMYYRRALREGREAQKQGPNSALIA